VAEKDGDKVTIEPLRAMPVRRDLIVDQSGFFRKFRAVRPYLVPAREPGEKEYLQSPGERDRIDDPTKCILCSSCYSACPVVREENPDFIGPAAAVQAARFVFDSRDVGAEARRDVLAADTGVAACENHFNCTKVCPRGIKVTKQINLTKRRLKQLAEEDDQAS
jgi:succinate dehydrogenase / fumarate reductase iron-sulfur subunit